MTSPDPIALHHGDCLDVLQTLPDASVDSVVTDPPYGLEFMGKEWDRFDHDSKARAGMSKPGIGDRETAWPSHLGGLNPRCRACGLWQRGANPCRCDSPDFPNERRARSAAFGEWCELWATECLRVLKPGGHLLAFGGTRTFHRLACAVEDAGFEIRDSIAWLYGSGFPKSLDVSKAIDKAAGAEREVLEQGTAVKRMIPGADQNATGSWIKDNGREYVPTVTAPATDTARTWQGWGTALKPAHEPIVVARKPLSGTVAGNVLAWGTGALNVDGCRIEHASEADLATSLAKNPGRSDTVTSDTYGAGRPQQSVNTAGRWPANVVLDEAMAAELDAQSGELAAGNHPAVRGGDRSDGVYALGHGGTEGERRPTESGGASRFLYVAKAGAAERVFYFRSDCDCEGPSPTTVPTVRGPKEKCPTCGAGTRRIAHPTVKPLALIRWLARLATPPNGTVLDLFTGSGTTVEACLLEGFHIIAIEREGEYLPLIRQRINRRRDPVQAVKTTGDDGGLFDLISEEAG